MTPRLMLMLLPGCTWVSQKDVDDKLASVDDDEDGYPLATDCDDSDPNINPGVEETWYDGLDSDCGMDSDYDQDGDGYVPTKYEGAITDGAPKAGALPGGDCWDIPEGPVSQGPAGAEIHPGISSDTWKDGVDADCAGNDDYDEDGDGYVEDQYEGEVTHPWNLGGLPGGDCNDTSKGADINPGQSEIWYDGIDQDCAGNDDYDQDGDGFCAKAFEAQCDLSLSGTGDCYDDPERAKNGFPGDEVYPGAPDAPYNGIDEDCGGNDDYDQDGDGYVPDAHVGLTTLYVDAPLLPGGDCCDTATVGGLRGPGVLEIIGDGMDQDCALSEDDLGTCIIPSEPDSFFVTPQSTLAFTSPGSVRFGENVDDLYLSVVFSEVASPTAYEGQALMTLDVDDLAVVDTAFLVNNASDDVANLDSQGFIVDDDAVMVAVTYFDQGSSSHILKVAGQDLTSSTGTVAAESVQIVASAFDDVTLFTDSSGNPRALACSGAGDSKYMAMDRSDLLDGGASTTKVNDTPTVAATMCAAYQSGADEGTLWASSGADIQFSTFTPVADTAVPPVYSAGGSLSEAPNGLTMLDGAGDAWALVVTDDQLLLEEADGSGGTTLNLPSVGSSAQGLSAQGMIRDQCAYVTWVADDDGDIQVGVAAGPLGGASSEFVMAYPIEVPVIAASSDRWSATWGLDAKTDHLVLAVAGQDEVMLGQAAIDWKAAGATTHPCSP